MDFVEDQPEFVGSKDYDISTITVMQLPNHESMVNFVSMVSGEKFPEMMFGERTEANLKFGKVDGKLTVTNFANSSQRTIIYNKQFDVFEREDLHNNLVYSLTQFKLVQIGGPLLNSCSMRALSFEITDRYIRARGGYDNFKIFAPQEKLREFTKCLRKKEI